MTTRRTTDHIVYKVDIYGRTSYLRDFNKQYPGNSVFVDNKNDAHFFTRENAYRTWKILKSGLDAGARNPYGYGLLQ